MGLALTILTLVLITNILQWTGHALIVDAAYTLWTRVFHPQRWKAREGLRLQVLKTKNDLDHTSAQNEFAKWAKLRRALDKYKADFEKLNAEIVSSKASFTTRFNWGVWALTSGAQVVIVWWYRRRPVFFLPPGWLGPLGWVFSLPFAPAGSVSCGAWQLACQRVVKLCERFVKSLLVEISLPSRSGPKTVKTQ